MLPEIREFVMVTWLIQKAAEDAQSAAEAAKRIIALRTAPAGWTGSRSRRPQTRFQAVSQSATAGIRPPAR